MNQHVFSLVTSVVFGLIALAHVLRIDFNLSLVIQGISIPMSASGLAVVVMAYLAYQAFRLARKSPSGA
jgi:NO-binding membrane sensor protein with MHYT domain